MKTYKGLKDFAKKKGVKRIQIIEIPNINQDDCPIGFPCFVIDKDKNMKVICEHSNH